MCTAGTRGLTRWAMRLTPVATKRGSSFAPGMPAAISGVNVPCTSLMCRPTFSKKRPCRNPITPPPPGLALPGSQLEAPGRSGIEVGRRLVLEGLESGDELVPQAVEPGARARHLGGFGQICAQKGLDGHDGVPASLKSAPLALASGGKALIWRKASPRASVAAVTTLRERAPGARGMRRRIAAAA